MNTSKVKTKTKKKINYKPKTDKQFSITKFDLKILMRRSRKKNKKWEQNNQVMEQEGGHTMCCCYCFIRLGKINNRN